MAMFRLSAPFTVGSNSSYQIATADIDGDGYLDLLVPYYNINDVEVFFGDGLGGFTAGGSVWVGTFPDMVKTGDFDGDGDIDFVTADGSGATVTVALNNGSGSFTRTPYAVGSTPFGLEVGDFNNDGHLDLVVADTGSNTLSILLNNGDGTFAAAGGSPIATGGTRPYMVVVDDFDGDGNADIVATNQISETASLLFGNGGGGFAAPVILPTGEKPWGVASGDVDGDGDSDLVVSEYDDGILRILFNDGAGAFTTSSTIVTVSQPIDVKLADLDGDGDLDLVASGWGGHAISIFLNDGAGLFTAESDGPILFADLPGAISLGDIDADGDLDMAVSSYGLPEVNFLINTFSTYSVTSATSSAEGWPGAAGELVFTITRTATSEVEDITYVLGGSATSGSDYSAPSGTVSFAAGQSTAEVRITIAADAIVEASETVTLTLVAASGGGTISASASSGTATITNDDTWVNAAPTGTSATITIDEDTSHTFAAADFGFADEDGNALSAVVVTTLPEHGSLELNGVAVTAGQSIAAADIGSLVWTPEADAMGEGLASFTFQVVDDGGTDNGGTDTDETPDTITFDVSDIVDTMKGTKSGDKLRGTDGADSLLGKGGNDKLWGNAGDDSLVGGAGDDTLWGGEGADAFVYTGAGRDRIMDFETGIDTIDLSGWSAIKSFADIRRHAENRGGDLWIADGQKALIIENFAKAQLDAADFNI